MRLDQMRRREDFDEVFMATLSRMFHEQFGGSFDVSPTRVAGAKAFRCQPVLSAYFTRGLKARGQRFLRDSIRFTPHRHRLVFQWAATTAWVNGVGLNLTSRPGFWVSPDLPYADELLIIPGNQRIRLFDFRRDVVRVQLKESFSDATMKREIAVRASGERGPFLPIVRSADDGHFLEEAIVDGWDLARCPPWVRPQRLRLQAQKTLLRWLERKQDRCDSRAFTRELLTDFEAALERVRTRFPTAVPAYLASWGPQLIRAADGLRHVMTSISHGDFQAGNVLVTRARQDILLVDWEHCGRRSYHYDFFTEGLASRSSKGLAQRIRAYLAGQKVGSPIDDLGDYSRHRLLAIFLLEDLIFYMNESLSGPFKQISEGLSQYLVELQSFGDDLAELMTESKG